MTECVVYHSDSVISNYYMILWGGTVVKTLGALNLKLAEAFCWQVLPRVSRTFAIGIERLPKQLGLPVMCAYLIARIADTIEDSPRLAKDHKDEMLATLNACLADPARGLRETFALSEGEAGKDYVELMAKTRLVFEVFRHLPVATRGIMREWLGHMISGMREVSQAHPGGIRIRTFDEYRRYCFFVAGTVGHLLTELWTRAYDRMSYGQFLRLRESSASFGEALQSVNILKDTTADFRQNDTIFIPEDLLTKHGSSHENMFDPRYLHHTQAALKELIDFAESGVIGSMEYLQALPRSVLAVRFFCVFPLLLAGSTLGLLRKNPIDLVDVGSAKVSRAEVRRILWRSIPAVCSNRYFEHAMMRSLTV